MGAKFEFRTSKKSDADSKNHKFWIIMPPRSPYAKHWCFTMNNYSASDIDRLLSESPLIEYIVFGKEISQTGTPHLQGQVCFFSKKRIPQIIGLIGQCHLSVTANLADSILYCKKGEQSHEEWTRLKASGPNYGLNYEGGERGEVPAHVQNSTNSRKKNNSDDIEAFKKSVKDGCRDMKVLRETHSSVCAAHPKFVRDYVADHKPAHCVTTFPLREWQETLNARLVLEPNPREIIFIVDTIGNTGKSWFARYYCDLHANAQIVVPGKKADMAYIVDEEMKVFFFDCPRSKQGDFIQYDFLEELKNGLFFSPKYQPRIKKLATPHVVVLMNEYPCMEKLSEDRYSVTVLES